MPENKVKGLLKGFRYISQIFDNEKEQEIQIGFPTDVKHVAHIGWDGPSVNSPSWMNEFKSPSRSASQPLCIERDIISHSDDDSLKWTSQDANKRGSRSINAQDARDLPDVPRSSRRQSTGSITDSPKREKSDKPKSSRKSSKLKDSTDGSSKTPRLPSDSLQGDDSPARSLPDIPKKPHRKKPKDACNGPSKPRLKAQTTDTNSDLGSPSSSSTKSRNKKKSFQDDGGDQ